MSLNVLRLLCYTDFFFLHNSIMQAFKNNVGMYIYNNIYIYIYLCVESFSDIN